MEENMRNGERELKYDQREGNSRRKRDEDEKNECNGRGRE
jgi:hypothetical protein